MVRNDTVSSGEACCLLVRLGVVQPQATQDGAHHSGHDQRQTDPSRVQLLVLMGRGDRRRR